jgi:hypothetical protein
VERVLPRTIANASGVFFRNTRSRIPVNRIFYRQVLFYYTCHPGQHRRYSGVAPADARRSSQTRHVTGQWVGWRAVKLCVLRNERRVCRSGPACSWREIWMNWDAERAGPVRRGMLRRQSDEGRDSKENIFRTPPLALEVWKERRGRNGVSAPWCWLCLLVERGWGLRCLRWVPKLRLKLLLLEQQQQSTLPRHYTEQQTEERPFPASLPAKTA